MNAEAFIRHARCFDFSQRLIRDDGCELARVLVQMCCVDTALGALAEVPDDAWMEWSARMDQGMESL